MAIEDIVNITYDVNPSASSDQFEISIQSYLEAYRMTQEQIYNHLRTIWPDTIGNPIEVTVQVYSSDDYSVEMWR